MKKGLILFNNKIEDVEALATKALLTRAGFSMTSFTLETTLDLETAFKQKIKADLFINEVKEHDFDFLVLPGGAHVTNWLENKALDKLILKFNENNKLIAAICAAPLFLNKVNLLKNKEFTAFPSVVEKITGIFVPNVKVVKSENIITARSAGVVYDFTFEIIESLTDKEQVNKIKNAIVY